MESRWDVCPYRPYSYLLTRETDFSPHGWASPLDRLIGKRGLDGGGASCPCLAVRMIATISIPCVFVTATYSASISMEGVSMFPWRGGEGAGKYHTRSGVERVLSVALIALRH